MNRTMPKIFVIACSILILLVMVIVATTRRDNMLNVSVVLPLTGPSAEFGNSVKRVMDKWMEANSGKTHFRISYIDAESSPVKAVSAFHENAVSHRPDVVIVGPTYLANAIIPAAAEMDVFVLPIATFFSALKNMDKYQNFQAVSMNIEDSITPIIEKLRKEHLNCAVVYSNDDFGMLSKNFIEEHFDESLIVATYPFSPNDNTIRDTMARCINSKVSAVVVTGTTYPAYISAIRELFQQGFEGIVFADIAYSNPFVIKAMGNLADRPFFVCTTSDFWDGSGTDLSQGYYVACQQLNEPPYFLSLQAWDSLTLTELLVSNNINLNRNSIISTGFDGVLHNLRFSDNGAANYSCCLARLQNGKLIEE